MPLPIVWTVRFRPCWLRNRLDEGKNMNIFITGGTGGLGRHIAMEYLREGHRVGVCGDSREVFDEVFSGLENIDYFVADVTDRQSICTAVRSFAPQQLDLLIGCAGISERVEDKKQEIDFDRLAAIINVNLSGVINSFEAALAIMAPAGHGHLVAISSIAGLAGMPKALGYSTSKGAVNTFCEALAIRLQPQNIHVTTILPGFIDTPLARGTLDNLDSQPFVLSPQKAALMCKKAIDKKKLRYIFPLPMRVIAAFFSLLPKSLYIKLSQRFTSDPY